MEDAPGTGLNAMKIIVAGENRSGDLGSEIAGAARAMVAAKGKKEFPFFLKPEDSALSLCFTKTEAEYLARLTTLMLGRAGIGTLDFPIPRKPGFTGSVGVVVKRILWKLLRYQHDRAAFQQNAINCQLTAAVELIRAEYVNRIAALEKKVAELEKKDN